MFQRLIRLAIWLCFLGASGHAQKVGSVTFTPPPGWTVKVTGGMATFAPPGGPAGGVLLLIPDQKVTGDARAWLAATVKQLSGDGQIVESGDITAQKTAAGLPALITANRVKLAQGVQLRLYLATLSGTQATLYVLVAPGDAALKTGQSALLAVMNSVRGPGQAAAATPSAAGSGALPGQKTALPAVKPVNAAQFVASGGHPESQLIPDEFRCYQEKAGNSLTPELTLQILPGGKYRTPSGAGSVTVKKDGSLIKLEWRGGVLNGAYGYLNFGDYGQNISLNNVGEDVLDRTLSFECYQRGPRENLALLEFKLKTPAAAKYPCALKDSGKGGGTLELLAGGQYRLNGQTGRYSYDFRSDQGQDWSKLDFTGGALDDATGSYRQDETGLREVSVYRPGLSCRTVTKPAPLPQYGSARAPAPPGGSGGLSGAYVHWYADPLAALGYGGCGGLCFDVLIFDKSGYVFTDEPEASLDEASCARTHPNGLPVCEVYRVQNGKITIGTDKPQTFARSGRDLKIGGDTYSPMLALDGVRLGKTYESKSFVGGGAGSTVSGAFQNTLAFTAQGKFSRERSGGVSSTFTDNGNSTGNVTGGFTATSQSASSGTYAFKGYTLTLTYGDGRVERKFAFALPDKNGKPDLGLLRLGGSSYTVPDGK